MKVQCINQANFKNLTSLQSYDVVSENLDFYEIISNDGKVRSYSKRYFQIIEEEVVDNDDQDGVAEDDEVEIVIEGGEIRIIFMDDEISRMSMANVAGSCGIISIDGLNDLYEVTPSGRGLENKRAENFKEIISKVIESIFEYTDISMIVFSTNDTYEEIYNVMGEICDYKTAFFLNQNSDREIFLSYVIR
jgi:hypothetical protein